MISTFIIKEQINLWYDYFKKISDYSNSRKCRKVFINFIIAFYTNTIGKMEIRYPKCGTHLM
jgi:hypothetical protein